MQHISNPGDPQPLEVQDFAVVRRVIAGRDAVAADASHPVDPGSLGRARDAGCVRSLWHSKELKSTRHTNEFGLNQVINEMAKGLDRSTKTGIRST